MLFSILRFLLRVLFRTRLNGDLSGLYKEKVIITPNQNSFIYDILQAVILTVQPL